RLFLQDARRQVQQHQKDDPDEVIPQINKIKPRNGLPLRGFCLAHVQMGSLERHRSQSCDRTTLELTRNE
ncbi:MAG: hypothetical protein WCR92_08810, partial [Candidatus Cloacimonadaceae bacterium]